MKNFPKIVEDKKKIRQKILKIRQNLDFSKVQKKSKKMQQILENSEFFKISKNILFFFPVFGEPDFLNLAKKYLRQKRILFPRVIKNKFGKTKMEIAEIKNFADFSPGIFKILVPKKEIVAEKFPENIDLFLVPAVAVDFFGNRIGMGGGFFDKFLSNLKGKKIATVFDFQIFPKIPYETHDQKMDFILSEKGLVKAK